MSARKKQDAWNAVRESNENGDGAAAAMLIAVIAYYDTMNPECEVS